MELVLQNNLAELPRLHEALDALNRDQGWPDRSLANLQVALEEHLANVINYGYPKGQPGQIVVRIHPHEAGLEVEVEDDGKAFNPLAQPQPDLTVPFDQRPVGGLGIHFLKELTDSQSYHRQHGHNILKVVKRVG